MFSRASLLPLLFLALLQSPQDSIRRHYEAAESHRRSGDLAAAEIEYTTILAEGYAKLGKIYTAQGRYKEAASTLEAASRYRPDAQDVLLDLAIAYFDADEFKQAVALDPHFPRAHYYLGLTYLLKDGAARLDDAAQEFKVELDTHPDEFFANYYLGIVCAIERKWEPAISFLEKASRVEPNN